MTEQTPHIAMPGISLTDIRKTYGTRQVLGDINMALAGAGQEEIWADVSSLGAECYAPGMPVWCSWHAGAPRVLARSTS